MRTLNKHNIVIGDVPQIERDYKITEDLRNNDKNARATVYEIIPNKLYALVVKQLGQYKKVLTAQNELTLLFRTPYIFNELN